MAEKNRLCFQCRAFVCFLIGLFCLVIPRQGIAATRIRIPCKPTLMVDGDGHDALSFGGNSADSHVFPLPHWRPDERLVHKILSELPSKKPAPKLRTLKANLRRILVNRKKSHAYDPFGPDPEDVEIDRRALRDEWFQAEAERIVSIGIALSQLADVFDSVYLKEIERLAGRRPDTFDKHKAWEAAQPAMEEVVEEVRAKHPKAIELFDLVGLELRNSSGIALVNAALSKQREVLAMMALIEGALQRIVIEPRSIEDATDAEFELALQNAQWKGYLRPMEPEKEQMLDEVAESILMNCKRVPKIFADFVREHEKYLNDNGMRRSRSYYEMLSLIDAVYSMGYHPTI